MIMSELIYNQVKCELWTSKKQDKVEILGYCNNVYTRTDLNDLGKQ